MHRELATSELGSFPSLDWSDIAPSLTTPVRSSLEKVLETQDGGDLSLQDSYTLANSGGDDLLGLLVAANLLRAELVGNIVTYVVNRNINFTNVCFVGCKFCAFSRGPREADSYFHSLDDMARKAAEAWELGATEVCIQGGLPRDLPKFYYRDILRAVKNAVPRMHIHAFSPMEIAYGVELTGMPLAEYLSMLRDIQSETGGFTEFVPLGFVHQNTLLFQQGLARSGPTLAEHLKVHALARILLAGSINNLQVSWVKLNRQLSQLCLHAGANDYGGTLMEENISREAGATAGQYTSPEDFRMLILEAGRIPAERSTTYSRINIKAPVDEFTLEQTPEAEFA